MDIKYNPTTPAVIKKVIVHEEVKPAIPGNITMVLSYDEAATLALLIQEMDSNPTGYKGTQARIPSSRIKDKDALSKFNSDMYYSLLRKFEDNFINYHSLPSSMIKPNGVA